MTLPEAGWYDDGSGRMRWWDGGSWTDSFQADAAQTDAIPQAETAADAGRTDAGGFFSGLKAEADAGATVHHVQEGFNYVVLQVVLKEKLIGAGSKNLTSLEKVINRQAQLGYRLHTFSTASSGTTGFGGGDRIQATLVFEKLA